MGANTGYLCHALKKRYNQYCGLA